MIKMAPHYGGALNFEHAEKHGDFTVIEWDFVAQVGFRESNHCENARFNMI